MKHAVQVSHPRQAVLRRMSAFTLIELLVTMTVATILLSVGIPSFSTFIQNDRLTSQANTLIGSLQLARSEAIKRDISQVNPQVTIQSIGGSWTTGWNVALCTTPCVTPLSPPIQSSSALSGGNTLSLRTNPNSGPAVALTTLAFGSNGGTNGLPPGTSEVIFTLCDTRGASYARAVQVDLLGRMAVSQKPGQQISAPATAATALTCP